MTHPLQNLVNQDFFEIEGLTFTNSNVWSVGAWDRIGTKAIFRDCQWVNNAGKFLISNFYRPAGITPLGQPLPAMSVQFIDSTFKNNKLKHKWQRLAGKQDISQQQEAIFFSQEGAITIQSSILSNNHGDEIIHASKSGIVISNTVFDRNQARLSPIHLTETNITVDVSSFRSTKSSSATIFAQDCHVTIDKVEFRDNHGFADIGLLDYLSDGKNPSQARIHNSCFSGGAYFVGPVFVDGNSSLLSNKHNFANANSRNQSSTSLEFCDQGALEESIAPSFSGCVAIDNEQNIADSSQVLGTGTGDSRCDGVCEPFIANSCSLDLPTEWFNSNDDTDDTDDTGTTGTTTTDLGGSTSSSTENERNQNDGSDQGFCQRKSGACVSLTVLASILVVVGGFILYDRVGSSFIDKSRSMGMNELPPFEGINNNIAVPAASVFELS